ncbi:MAG: YihY/virulence factor BrkB family protein [Pyrinomonadaceae bacterium]|nr:YihY/virulence factor BrkB family protein [Phycisphaerales bacterium]
MPARWYAFAKGVVKDFIAHDVMSLAAAVAFYTALSFAPLVLLLIATGSFLGDSTQNDLIHFFDQQLGPRAAEVTEAVVENANSESEETSVGRWILSTILLIVSASGVFGQLQSSLNTIWETEGKSSEGIWSWLRKRLISMGMVFTILFILLVALVISSVIEQIVPSGEELASRIGVFVGSFVVTTLLFAAVFKVLPDRKVPWRSVWLGAVITSALFSLGKLLVSLYMEHGGVGESYGKAAGALIALLVWVYYSCIILFLGAEITQRISNRDDTTQRMV